MMEIQFGGNIVFAEHYEGGFENPLIRLQPRQTENPPGMGQNFDAAVDEVFELTQILLAKSVKVGIGLEAF